MIVQLYICLNLQCMMSYRIINWLKFYLNILLIIYGNFAFFTLNRIESQKN